MENEKERQDAAQPQEAQSAGAQDASKPKSLLDIIKRKLSSTWKRVVWWYIVHFMNSKVKELQTGGFTFVFRKYTVTIKTDNDFWSIKFRSDFIASPMLFYIAEKNDLNGLFGYAVKLYEISNFMCRDQGFLDGLDRELNKYVKRLSKKAETVASQVSPEQEEGDAALMRDAAKYNKNDKRKRAQDREVMREVVSEFKGKTAKEE
jgi:hypothetical protein